MALATICCLTGNAFAIGLRIEPLAKPKRTRRKCTSKVAGIPTSFGRGGGADTPARLVPSDHHAIHGSNAVKAAPAPKTSTITFRQDRRGPISWLLNCLWLATVGWPMFATWFLVGLILCCTIVGLPAGYQAIKISFFLLFPFGKSLAYTKSSSASTFLLNLVWAVTVGWILALQAFATGAFLVVSIVGIPFGLQCFKFAHLCFRPFGIDYSAIEETTYVVVKKQDA